jgi:hypothetical protein
MTLKMLKTTQIYQEHIFWSSLLLFLQFLDFQKHGVKNWVATLAIQENGSKTTTASLINYNVYCLDRW